jgi:hypothetical protein
MDAKDEVERLVKKAAEAAQSHEALHFSQAALNVAHARQVVKQTK